MAVLRGAEAYISPNWYPSKQETHGHEVAELKPWKMGDSEPAFIDTMLRNVVGIEIAFISLTGKVKFSQNRELRDRLHAAALDAREQKTMLQVR